jgi:hypothetical protein
MWGPRTRWCFTWWKVDDEARARLENIYHDIDVTTMFVEDETGEETGGHHWQGYIEVKTHTTIAQVKELFLLDDTVHVEAAHGSKWQNYRYCTKQTAYIVKGLGNAKDGKSDQQARAVIEASRTMTPEQFVEEFPAIWLAKEQSSKE